MQVRGAVKVELCKADERARWDAVFATRDPWNYQSPYEQRKYLHTFSLFPQASVPDALELGCAEGIFTEALARRADRVLAVDISATALNRARLRCERISNVQFAWCDISGQLPQGEFDIIVCSEILYYLQDRYALAEFSRKVSRLLKPGGSLIATHANNVSDDPDVTGFDFAQIGARFIGQTFAQEVSLEFACELRTELYRVQRFTKVQPADRRTWGRSGVSALEVREEDASFEHPTLKIGGCVVNASEARYCYRTTRIPILMYHRIADAGPAELAPHRVSSEIFARQMQYLHRNGYRAVSMDEASESYGSSIYKTRPGRLITLTFDDGYRDFIEVAWPILKRYGFSATVYIPTDYVGGNADWDSAYGTPAPLLSWDEIRQLSNEGVCFGAHSRNHRRLTEVDSTERALELSQSREAIRSATGQPVTSFSYPYGSYDHELCRMASEAGFENAVAAGLTSGEDLFELPRIAVLGAHSLDCFVASLPSPEFAPEPDILEFRRLCALRDRRLYMD